MSSMESAPAIIPPTMAGIFRCALTPNGLAQLDLVGDQALQTGPFSQLQDRRQTSARHQIRVVKHGRDVVTASHLAAALLFAAN